MLDIPILEYPAGTVFRWSGSTILFLKDENNTFHRSTGGQVSSILEKDPSYWEVVYLPEGWKPPIKVGDKIKWDRLNELPNGSVVYGCGSKFYYPKVGEKFYDPYPSYREGLRIPKEIGGSFIVKYIAD